MNIHVTDHSVPPRQFSSTSHYLEGTRTYLHHVCLIIDRYRRDQGDGGSNIRPPPGPGYSLLHCGPPWHSHGTGRREEGWQGSTTSATHRATPRHPYSHHLSGGGHRGKGHGLQAPPGFCKYFQMLSPLLLLRLLATPFLMNLRLKFLSPCRLCERGGPRSTWSSNCYRSTTDGSGRPPRQK